MSTPAHDNGASDKLVKWVALAIYHAPGGKRFLNWFFDWCER